MKIFNKYQTILAYFLCCLTLFTTSTTLVIAGPPTVELINIDYDYNIEENGDAVYIDVSLTSAHDSDINIELDFSTSSATLGQDFNVLDATTWSTFINNNQSINIVIPTGSLSKRIFLQTLIDYTHEENESINIAISNASGNINFDPDPLATITIDDNDAYETENSIVLTNASGDYNIGENGDGVYMAVILSTPQITDTNVVIDFNSSSAIANNDFKIIDKSSWQELPITNGELSLTIPAGNLSHEFFVNSVEDDLYEGEEVIEVRIISAPQGINLGSKLSDTITIDDNDEAPIEGLYYVGLNGNNLNTGSADYPFKTIEHGLSTLAPGDTLVVYPGHYNETDIEFTTSGTVNSPITIKAETAGTVFFKGSRPIGVTLAGGFGYAFILNDVSNIIIDGFTFSDFNTGISIHGDKNNDQVQAENIVIKNSTFKNNAGSGIISWKLDNLTVSHSNFISLEPIGGWANPIDPEAIQDYGVSIYHSTGSTVEDSYFFGGHHQALSFKYGNHNGAARRNIFAGNLYTALYLGQDNLSPTYPVSSNLIAEHNIFRNAENYRLKNAITAHNVNGAIIRENYIEGFGIKKSGVGSIGGIQVFDNAKGKIEIYNNIIAFSRKKIDGINLPSIGVYPMGVTLDWAITPETVVDIHNNTIYNIFQEFYVGSDPVIQTFENYTFENNIIGQCTDHYFAPPAANPDFINGVPTPLPLDAEPTQHDFDTYYNKLTSPFTLNQ